jgi:surface antigen
MERKQIMRTKIIAVVTASLFSLLLMTGCQSVSNRDVGMATGAVLGGVLGAQVGKGHGRTAAIIVGTLAGAYIGGAIGSSMDRQDRYYANQSLENYRDNQSNTWTNPNSGNQYTVTPTSTYQSNNSYCREYTTEAVIDGRRETIYGTACRQPDGTWQAAN